MCTGMDEVTSQFDDASFVHYCRRRRQREKKRDHLGWRAHSRGALLAGWLIDVSVVSHRITSNNNNNCCRRTHERHVVVVQWTTSRNRIAEKGSRFDLTTCAPATHIAGNSNLRTMERGGDNARWGWMDTAGMLKEPLKREKNDIFLCIMGACLA